MLVVRSPLGEFQFVPRDLARWPRNAVPPAAEPALIRGVTAHYPGGPIGSLYRGSLVAGDEALVGRSIANHNARPGLTDVGYNLFVGRSGRVWDGRGVRARNGANGPILASIRDQYPSGTTTTNRFWVSVFLCVGTDAGWQAMTPVQRAAFLRVCAWVRELHQVKNMVVNGHRDVRATACPGDAVHRELAAITAELNQTTIPPVIPPAPTVQEDTVQAVATPQRMLDTRKTGARFTAGETRVLPLFMANEVVVNVTVVNPAAAGYVVVWDGRGGRPGTSNVNFEAGQTTSNLARTRTAGGRIAVHTTAACDIVLDLQAAG